MKANFVHGVYTKVIALFLLLFFLAQIVSQNSILGLLFIIITVLLWFLVTHFTQFYIQQHFNNKLIWMFVGLLILISTSVTILVAFFFKVSPVSDPLNALIKANELNQGNFNWHISHVAPTDDYFYSYPNTVPYTIILSKVISFFSFFKLNVLDSFRLFNTILILGSNYFLISTVYVITKKPIATLQASLIVLCVPVLYLYPNLVIYSDTLSVFIFSVIFFIVAMLYCSKNKLVMWILTSLLMLTFALGYAIKSNIIILIPAIVLVILMSLVTKIQNKLRSLAIFLAMFLGLLLTLQVTPSMEKHYGYHIDETKHKALPPTHWINMGLNIAGTNGPGSYDLNDDNADRQAVVNNDTDFISNTVKKRFRSFSVFSLIDLWSQKFKMLMGTPLFGFGKYQSGWIFAPNIYVRHQGAIDYLLNVLSAGIIAAIVLKIYLSLINKERIITENGAYYYFVITSAIGLAMFHTVLWETEPRYFLPMLMPLLLIDSFSSKTTSSLSPLESIFYKKFYKIGTFICLSAVLCLIGISQTSTTRYWGGSVFGNNQYDARIPLKDAIVMRNNETFILPVRINGSYDFRVNIPALSSRGIKVNGVPMIPSGDHYELNSYFEKNTCLKIEISSDGKSNPVFLYHAIEKLNIYSGSTISVESKKYFLPYTLHLQDKQQQSPNIYSTSSKSR